jgi:outer membrane receptor protein involved in Fe transport
MTRIVALVWSAVVGIVTPAAAQHEHHGVPADSARVVLDAVTTRAERVAVALRSGATVVHTRASAAAGGSIADLLRTVPGVELDADGRISMRGSTSVLVLMNGRRMPLTGDALLALLRQMPAAALERVEAGTTASAQGADGTAGVVNLVSRTEAAPHSGLRSLAGSMTTDHYMGSAAATGDVREVLNWDVMYSLSGMRPRTNATTARWSVVPGDLPLQTHQDSRSREKHRLHSVLAGAAVTPTPHTSLELRGAYSWMEGAHRDSSAFSYTNAAGDTDASTIGGLLEHVVPSGELSAVAQVDRGTVRFMSEARGSFMNEDLRGAHDDADAGYRYMTTVMVSRRRESVLRNDLGLRFPGIDVDVGQESRFRTVTAAHEATHFDATLSRAYRHELDVHAGYLAAHRSIAGVHAEAGLRVEADRTRIQLETASARTAVRVFPSIGGEWRGTDGRRTLVYRFAYGRRIHRPGAEMLSPFSMGGDHMEEIIGNPSLVAEVSDQVEFGMEQHRPRATLLLTPFVRWTRDPIRRLKAATARGGATTTLENLTRARAMGADGSVRSRPADGIVVTLAGSVARDETTAEVFRSSGVYATARLTVDLQVAENTTAQFYAYRRSAQAIEQGEILPAFTSDLALTQLLAGDRARVTLRLNDPLRSDRLEYRIADATFTQESRRRTARPLLSLFASWAVDGEPRQDAPVRKEGPRYPSNR